MESWTYKVRYLNKETDKEIESYGLVTGKNFTDATRKICNAFGEDIIFTISLDWLDEGELIKISKETVEAVRNCIE